MDVSFHTYDDYDSRTRHGWNLSWVATTPGECQQHPAPRMHYSSIVVTIFFQISHSTLEIRDHNFTVTFLTLVTAWGVPT